MAFIASGVEFVAGHSIPLRAGVWTRVAQGPLVVGLPFQLFYFQPFDGRLPTVTIDLYSASPPFYDRTRVTAASIVATPYAPSPWVEIWVLSSLSKNLSIVMY